MALLFYCNYEDLQHELSTTYRLINEQDTAHRMIKRHQQYINWAMLISDTLSRFGSFMTNSEELYRGISGNIIVPKATATFFAPTSTSRNVLVAQNFAGHEGIVLYLSKAAPEKATGNVTTARYFDCSWLSDFHYEAENLFAGIKGNLLSITSIVDCKTGGIIHIDQQIVADYKDLNLKRLKEIFYDSISEHYQNKQDLLQTEKVDKDSYIKAVQDMMNETASEMSEASLEAFSFQTMCRSLQKVIFSAAMIWYYPSSLFNHSSNSRSINFLSIFKTFSNALKMYFYDFDMEIQQFGQLSNALILFDSLDFKLKEIHINDAYCSIFPAANWILLTNHGRALYNHRLNCGVIIRKYEKISIDVQQIPQRYMENTTQFYRIILKVDDIEIECERRYSQFSKFRDGLRDAKLIDKNQKFPRKGLVMDIGDRAKGLDQFIKNILNICIAQKRLYRLCSFLAS